ncbi:hypothetical protein GCM10009665_10100 [Kitasatospora nipponensis]|uniref:Protein-tyrosine-phosphatase-like N-terminal domain-containing protein n=1 Tax=Kitasatospora nipponensis TaxID=258049 RepID=A0ABP4GDM3_9ACTN
MTDSPPQAASDPTLSAGAARLALRYAGTSASETLQRLLDDSYRLPAEGATVRSFPQSK